MSGLYVSKGREFPYEFIDLLCKILIPFFKPQAASSLFYFTLIRLSRRDNSLLYLRGPSLSLIHCYSPKEEEEVFMLTDTVKKIFGNTLCKLY
jgi:hypothetical protein